MAAVHTRLVGVPPTGREPPTDLPTRGMDPQADPGVLLAAVARAGRKRATATPTRIEGADAESGSELSGCLALGPDREFAKGALERHPADIRLSDAIGSSGSLTPLVSTAGCGKPHVRWCGRVTGRNPRHSTRSSDPPCAETRVGGAGRGGFWSGRLVGGATARQENAG